MSGCQYLAGWFGTLSPPEDVHPWLADCGHCPHLTMPITGWLIWDTVSTQDALSASELVCFSILGSMRIVAHSFLPELSLKSLFFSIILRRPLLLLSPTVLGVSRGLVFSLLNLYSAEGDLFTLKCRHYRLIMAPQCRFPSLSPWVPDWTPSVFAWALLTSQLKSTKNWAPGLNQTQSSICPSSTNGSHCEAVIVLETVGKKSCLLSFLHVSSSLFSYFEPEWYVKYVKMTVFCFENL